MGFVCRIRADRSILTWREWLRVWAGRPRPSSRGYIRFLFSVQAAAFSNCIKNLSHLDEQSGREIAGV